MSRKGSGKAEENEKVGASPPAEEDQRPPFTRFDDLAKKVFSIDKEELDRRERAWRKKK